MPRTRARSGSRSSTSRAGSSAAAARLRRSCARCSAPRNGAFGRGEDREAGARHRLALRRRRLLSGPGDQDGSGPPALRGSGGDHRLGLRRAVSVGRRRAHRHHRVHLRHRGEAGRGFRQARAGGGAERERVPRRSASGRWTCRHSRAAGLSSAKPAAAGDHRVGGDAAESDAVADEGDAVAVAEIRRAHADAGERFRRGEQVLQPGHAEHAGAAQRRLHHRVAEARAVGLAPARPERHHRARAGDGARGGDEGAAVPDAADVEEHDARFRVAGDPVERGGEADIGVAADADHVAEAEAFAGRPVEHGARGRCGLAHQRELAARRLQVRERCVQPQARHAQSEAVRPQHAHARCGPRSPSGPAPSRARWRPGTRAPRARPWRRRGPVPTGRARRGRAARADRRSWPRLPCPRPRAPMRASLR